MNLKKGFQSFEDVLYVLVYIFSAALLIFILYFAYNQINTPIADALTNATSDGGTTYNYTAMGDSTLGAIGIFNTLFPLLILGLIVMCAVGAMYIDSHPVFFFVSLFILGIVILLGVVYSNIYEQITTDSAFGATASNFLVMNLFMKYLPWVIAIVLIITMIIMWAKPGGSGGGGL
jgi:hypothetical protein